MGNSNGRQSGASSPHHHSTSSSANHSVRTFDGGSLSPHGIYPGRPDYNPIHVLKYIRERRLAPFYKGLDDYEDEWSDYQLSHFVKEGKLPPTPDSPSSVPPPGGNSSSPSLMLPPSVDEQANVHPNPPRVRGMSLVEPNQQTPISSSTNPGVPTNDKGGRPRAQTTGSSTIIPTRGKPLEALVYRSAIECPVCFLFYPPNINRTRCCWKPICTECFVEMKRSEPHYPSNDDNPTPGQPPINLNPMNLISDPVRCPFCVKPEFGVVYNPPPWLPSQRGRDNTLLPPREIATSPLQSDADLPMDKREEMYPPGHERVVLSDNIRPDWYQALAHRRRVEARRLATATALQQALAVAGQRRRGATAGTRPAPPNGPGGLGGMSRTNGEQRRIGRRVEGIVRITRDEADEMMLQEAIRQSLQTEQDERQKREEEERKKGNPETSNSAATSTSTSVPRLTSSTSSSPIIAPVLPRLRQSTSTSPPSPRSILSAFRPHSGSGSSRNGTSPPSNSPSQTTRRPSSTTNLSPPIVNTIRRQPSLPDTLLSSTSASLATAMHDSIVPVQNNSRPSIPSPLATQAVGAPNVQIESVIAEGSTPPRENVTTSNTVGEISPVEMVTQDSSRPLKTRGDRGSVEEREVVELTH